MGNSASAGPAPSHIGAIGVDSAVSVADDVWLHVMAFAAPEDTAALESTCRTLREACTRHRHTCWRPAIDAEARDSYVLRGGAAVATSQLDTASDSKALYLALRAVRQRARLTRLRSILPLARAVSQQRAVCAGIGDLVSDVAWLDDPAVARALMLKRRSAGGAVIVQTSEDIVRFRQARPAPYRGPVNFLPLDAPMAATWAEGPAGAHAIESLPRITHPGFIGYAIHLLRLRPEHEPLRRTVLYTLFRNLAVFDTEAHARAYEASAEAGRAWTCNVEHGLPSQGASGEGETDEPAAAVEPRLLCIQLLHLLPLEDAAEAGTRQRPAPTTPAEAVAARLVATTRCGAGVLSEIRSFGVGRDVLLGRLDAGQLAETLRKAERAYARTLTGLEAALRVRRLWSMRGVAGVGAVSPMAAGGVGQGPGTGVGV